MIDFVLLPHFIKICILAMWRLVRFPNPLIFMAVGEPDYVEVYLILSEHKMQEERSTEDHFPEETEMRRFKAACWISCS